MRFFWTATKTRRNACLTSFIENKSEDQRALWCNRHPLFKRSSGTCFRSQLGVAKKASGYRTLGRYLGHGSLLWVSFWRHKRYWRESWVTQDIAPFSFIEILYYSFFFLFKYFTEIFYQSVPLWMCWVILCLVTRFNVLSGKKVLLLHYLPFIMYYQ